MRYLMLCLTLLLSCATALAQPTVRLDADSRHISLAGQLSWLEDDAATLDAEQAAAKSDWQALPGEVRLGFSSAAIWLRLSLDVRSAAPRHWVLGLSNPLLEDVRLYRRDAGRDWQMEQSGRVLRNSQWPLATRTPAFALDLPSGRYELLLRLSGRPSINTAVQLWQNEAYFAHSSQQAMLYGLYYGMFVLVIMLQGLFWVWNREALSGWYVAYGCGLLLATLFDNGYPQFWLDLPTSWAVLGMALTLGSLPALLAGFTTRLLALPRHMPRLAPLYFWSIATISLISASLLLADVYYIQAMMLAQAGTSLWMTGTFALVAWLSWKRHKGALLYLLAFSILDLGAVLRYLRNFGVLEPSLLTSSGYQIAALLHMLLMCLFSVYRYKDMQQALAIEQQARQQQRDFVAMVSHEFRTPLAIINTSAQQLAANLDAPQEKTQTRCGNIRNAARRMTDLMDEYLSLERLENADQPARMSSCVPLELLEDAAADWPDGRVALHTQKLPSRFVCDPDLLQIALRNLLANADRHSPADTCIKLTATGDLRGGLRIEVIDQGEGLAPDELQQLFRKYFRGRAATNKPGAGLGLFMVKRIVELHDGQISAQSTLGQGARFVIQLPAHL